jgi:hypothetical protein
MRESKIVSLAAIASAAVSATLAPSSARASVLPGLRFQTVTSTPAARRIRAVARPIGPRPMTVTDL